MSHSSLPIPLSLSSSTLKDTFTTPANPLHNPDHINLTRLLTRLTHYLFTGDLSSPRTDLQTLRRSPYHRTRTLSDIEYARTLLLRLEHSTQGVKIQSQKRAALKDLSEKRRLIKNFRSRIEELSREGEAEAERTSDKDNGDGEDYFAPLRDQKEEMVKSFRDKAPDTEALSNWYRQSASSNPSSSFSSSDPPQLFSPNQSLRQRRGPPDPSPAIAAGSANSTHPSSSSSSPPLDLHTARSLEAASGTQADLSDSLVAMASQLKRQSQAMSASLETDKTWLSRASEGLEKNRGGMESAGRQMGMLRRMNEGTGFFGRLWLYGYIFGLWVVLVLFVFAGPKLRF